MKRTPLKRKTPLKSKTGFQKKTFKKIDAGQVQCSKSGRRGFTGYGRTASDKDWHFQVASLDCFACNHLGFSSTRCLRIHHPNGRNKGRDGDCCEVYVICLCDDHHDPSIISGGTDDSPSVHGNKRLFRDQIGSEGWCVYETYRQLQVRPKWLMREDWEEYLVLNHKVDQEKCILELERLSHRLRVARQSYFE